VASIDLSWVVLPGTSSGLELKIHNLQIEEKSEILSKVPLIKLNQMKGKIW